MRSHSFRREISELHGVDVDVQVGRGMAPMQLPYRAPMALRLAAVPLIVAMAVLALAVIVCAGGLIWALLAIFSAPLWAKVTAEIVLVLAAIGIIAGELTISLRS